LLELCEAYLGNIFR